MKQEIKVTITDLSLALDKEGRPGIEIKSLEIRGLTESSPKEIADLANHIKNLFLP